MSENLYVIIAWDRDGSETARAEHREGHLAHFKSNAENIAVAGPLSGAASGSLVIYRADNAADARAFIEADPFHSAEVWEKIDVLDFRAGAGEWLR